MGCCLLLPSLDNVGRGTVPVPENQSIDMMPFVEDAVQDGTGPESGTPGWDTGQSDRYGYKLW
jgi:hypothetical protein